MDSENVIKSIMRGAERIETETETTITRYGCTLHALKVVRQLFAEQTERTGTLEYDTRRACYECRRRSSYAVTVNKYNPLLPPPF